MGNKKVYLSSAILLLVAAAIGVGLWLQHRAEQKREERKNAIYGYWKTANLKSDIPLCIEIGKDRVVRSMAPTAPSHIGEVVPTIDEKGIVTLEVTMQPQSRNAPRLIDTFTLAPDDSLKMSSRFPGTTITPPDVVLKRITRKEYDDHWRPLDLSEWEKGKHFVDDDYTCFVSIKGISSDQCYFMSVVKSSPQATVQAKSNWISAYKGAFCIAGSSGSQRFVRVYASLGENKIYGHTERKTFHLLTPEEYKANAERIFEINATGMNLTKQDLQRLRPILDSLFKE